MSNTNVHLQDIGKDTDRPHVGGEGDRLVVDNLRGTELCRAKEHLDLLAFLQTLGQAKVDDLDVVGLPCDTHHILRLFKERKGRKNITYGNINLPFFLIERMLLN